MTNTPLLHLPYLMPSQAQKHVTHNEALRMLDALVQLSCTSASIPAPPPDPSEGQRFIIPDDPQGDWTGRAGSLAAWQDGAWSYFRPEPGWQCYVEDEGRIRVYTGSTWSESEAALPETTPRLGINASADTVNRLAVASDATLLTHDGNGHQLKINRGSAAQTASLLYQNDYSGRAECGLIGNNDWRVKVSADNVQWRDAIIVDNADGTVRFPSGMRLDAGNFTLSLGTIASGGYAGATGLTQLYARYTRIGDLCFCRAGFHLTGLPSVDLTPGSTLHLRGLPFEVANLTSTVDQFAAGGVYRSIGSGQNTLLGGYCSNTDNLYLFSFALTSNNARNTDLHVVSFSYQVA